MAPPSGSLSQVAIAIMTSMYLVSKLLMLTLYFRCLMTVIIAPILKVARRRTAALHKICHGQKQVLMAASRIGMKTLVTVCIPCRNS